MIKLKLIKKGRKTSLKTPTFLRYTPGSYCRWQEISYTQFAEFTLTIEDAQEYVYSISPTKRVRGWRDIEVKLYI